MSDERWFSIAMRVLVGLCVLASVSALVLVWILLVEVLSR